MDRQTDGQMAQLRAIDASERVKMASVPMTLDVGRFNAADARGSLSLVLLIVGVSCLGALVVVAAGPHDTYRAVSELGGFRQVLVWFGMVVCAVSFVVAGIALWITVTEWTDYRARLQDWHIASLGAYQQAGGQETESTLTVWELSTDSYLHVLGVALATHRRVQKGESTPYSVRSLEGDCWLISPDGNQCKVGVLPSGQAERAGKLLGHLGLIEGRKAKSAGTWVPSSEGEVIDLVTRNWHKR